MGNSQSATQAIEEAQKRTSYVYRAPQEEEDDQEYARLRSLAHEEAEKRNNCFEASQTAYKNRQGARAKELSNEGKQHDSLMKQYNKQAADLVFRKNNAHRPPTEVDLHGLFVKEASERVEEALQRCQQQKLDHLVIIVGKGLHSPGNIAKLKPAIVELVNKYQVSVQPDKPNAGCLYVEFGKGPSELSWLDRWLGLEGGCIIM